MTASLLTARSKRSTYPKEDAEQRAVIEWAQWVTGWAIWEQEI